MIGTSVNGTPNGDRKDASFLIIARMSWCDIPLRLFPGRDEAEDYYALLLAKDEESVVSLVQETCDRLGLRTSVELCCLMIVEFEDGRPVYAGCNELGDDIDADDD